MWHIPKSEHQQVIHKQFEKYIYVCVYACTHTHTIALLEQFIQMAFKAT